MTNLEYKRYQVAILALPLRLRELFCCACAEHVLPFYEHYQQHSELRTILDEVWECARTNRFSVEQIEEMEERAIPFIPNIQEDQSLEADISMKSGVVILEALSCLMGNEDSALNCGCSIFDTLVLADHVIQRETVRELNEIISDPLPSEEWIRDEWVYVQNMLEKLNAGNVDCYAVEWQKEQRDAGQKLLTVFKSQLK